MEENQEKVEEVTEQVQEKKEEVVEQTTFSRDELEEIKLVLAERRSHGKGEAGIEVKQKSQAEKNSEARIRRVMESVGR